MYLMAGIEVRMLRFRESFYWLMFVESTFWKWLKICNGRSHKKSLVNILENIPKKSKIKKIHPFLGNNLRRPLTGPSSSTWKREDIMLLFWYPWETRSVSAGVFSFEIIQKNFFMSELEENCEMRNLSSKLKNWFFFSD